MQSLRRNVRSNQLSSSKTTLKTSQNKGKLTIDGVGGNDVNLLIPTINESLDISSLAFLKPVCLINS